MSIDVDNGFSGKLGRGFSNVSRHTTVTLIMMKVHDVAIKQHQSDNPHPPLTIHSCAQSAVFSQQILTEPGFVHDKAYDQLFTNTLYNYIVRVSK